tara:strand:- start:7 stop:465 length:459 start_codon:yes stop_codon:yes gene_type:complete
MTFTRITTFIDVVVDSNGESQKYQNGNVGQSVNGHQYLSFIYQGAAMNRSGDNLESALILSANQISMNAVQAAVESRRKVTVQTYLMNESFTSRLNKLTEEIWIAASMSFDTETIEVLLSSAIDAVGATTPNRVLTRAMVGALPVSGTILSR